MGEKTRRPYLLGDDDFDTFCWDDTKKFLAGPNSEPHRPEHLVAQQATLADAFHAKLDEYRAAKQVRDNATSAFAEAATAIREKLRWMQMAFPGLTPGSDEILVPFGLDEDIKDDNDEMKNQADAVYAYWLTVRTEPLFAPFQANIDAFDALFTAYETSQANQTIAQEAASLLQNEKDDIRKQNEDVLMAIIDWYRIYYKDPQDEYWTQTPFGKSSGEGEPSGEIGIPENLAAEIIGEDVKISWDEVEDVDSYQLVHTEHLPLFLGLYDGEDTEYLHINPKGGTHHYNVRAKKGDSYSEYGEWVSVEVEGVVPNPPTALELEYEAAENRIKGKFQAPANSPDGFNAYVAKVPIGSSPPGKPVEAYYEDLFTLTFFIMPLQHGMTYYVWVTSVDDGEESEPCGPESIDIV